MSSDVNTLPQGTNVTPLLETGSVPEISVLNTKIADMERQLAAMRLELSEKKDTIGKERGKVVALNAEVLRAKLAVDRDITIGINDRVSRLNTQLDEAERDRDFFELRADAFQQRLRKSKAMNLALINFIAAVLGEGVYPECHWDELKLQQEC
ncbi:hypothetical protein BKA70DRAFT_1440922 [Coprinopsis sp. MPI-PUGE-AT-0042]|nr:hypothetical protein BKA70DRAFT_1440922 [Coprinopsis sp. MPI-PUGE-AT-0042]